MLNVPITLNGENYIFILKWKMSQKAISCYKYLCDMLMIIFLSSFK